MALKDGSEIPTRAVIVASGARYRRLAVEDLDRFEGAGVYYAATDLEARVCDGSSVLVVGGGNSAGQAAIYLGQHNCEVTIAIRREDLAQSMSRYLIERIEAGPENQASHRRRSRRARRSGSSRAGDPRPHRDGRQETIPCAGLFSFIGASPATSWLGDELMRRRLRVHSHRPAAPAPPTGGAPVPLPLETSIPGCSPPVMFATTR